MTVSSAASVDVGSGDGAISVAKEGGSTGTVIIGAASGANAVAPGSLSAASLDFGSSTGTLMLNHKGMESDATEFTFAIIGNGTIDVEAGRTELSADSSVFSGTTTVDVGTLALTGNLILRLTDTGSARGVANRCPAWFTMENRGGFLREQLFNRDRTFRAMTCVAQRAGARMRIRRGGFLPLR